MQTQNSSDTEHAKGEIITVSLETTTNPADRISKSLSRKTKPAPAADSTIEADFEAVVSKQPLKTAADLKKEQDDPFRPENLRLDQSRLQESAAKKLLLTVPVRKPNKQDFVRVHPGEDYRVDVALLEYERDTYVLAPSVCPELTESEFYVATLYVAINRQKVVFLWPVKLPGADGRQMDWHISAAEAAEKAMTKWVRMTSNMALGAYEVSEAIADYGEPEWPSQPLWDLIKIAFKNRLISSVDHLIVQKLRGLA